MAEERKVLQHTAEQLDAAATKVLALTHTSQQIDDATERVLNGSLSTKKVSVILSTDWTGTESPYTQVVTISGTTVNSKVDLQPDASVIAQLAEYGTVALYIANVNGTLTANAVGEKPTVELTIQATITEVSA